MSLRWTLNAALTCGFPREYVRKGGIRHRAPLAVCVSVIMSRDRLCGPRAGRMAETCAQAGRRAAPQEAPGWLADAGQGESGHGGCFGVGDEPCAGSRNQEECCARASAVPRAMLGFCQRQRTACPLPSHQSARAAGGDEDKGLRLACGLPARSSALAGSRGQARREANDRDQGQSPQDGCAPAYG
jgi:hypothetical protein